MSLFSTNLPIILGVFFLNLALRNVVGLVSWTTTMPTKLLHARRSIGVGTAKFVSFIRVAPYKGNKERKFHIVEGPSIVN